MEQNAATINDWETQAWTRKKRNGVLIENDELFLIEAMTFLGGNSRYQEHDVHFFSIDHTKNRQFIYKTVRYKEE